MRRVYAEVAPVATMVESDDAPLDIRIKEERHQCFGSEVPAL